MTGITTPPADGLLPAPPAANGFLCFPGSAAESTHPDPRRRAVLGGESDADGVRERRLAQGVVDVRGQANPAARVVDRHQEVLEVSAGQQEDRAHGEVLHAEPGADLEEAHGGEFAQKAPIPAAALLGASGSS